MLESSRGAEFISMKGIPELSDVKREWDTHSGNECPVPGGDSSVGTAFSGMLIEAFLLWKVRPKDIHEFII